MPVVTPGFKAPRLSQPRVLTGGFPGDLGTLYPALRFSGLWTPFLRSFCEQSLTPFLTVLVLTKSCYPRGRPRGHRELDSWSKAAGNAAAAPQPQSLCLGITQFGITFSVWGLGAPGRDSRPSTQEV